MSVLSVGQDTVAEFASDILPAIQPLADISFISDAQITQLAFEATRAAFPPSVDPQMVLWFFRDYEYPVPLSRAQALQVPDAGPIAEAFFQAENATYWGNKLAYDIAFMMVDGKEKELAHAAEAFSMFGFLGGLREYSQAFGQIVTIAEAWQECESLYRQLEKHLKKAESMQRSDKTVSDGDVADLVVAAAQEGLNEANGLQTHIALLQEALGTISPDRAEYGLLAGTQATLKALENALEAYDKQEQNLPGAMEKLNRNTAYAQWFHDTLMQEPGISQEIKKPVREALGMVAERIKQISREIKEEFGHRDDLPEIAALQLSGLGR